MSGHDLFAMNFGPRARRALRAIPALLAFLPGDAFAATEAHLNGAELGLVWALPFLGMLLSIALFPLRAPRLWEHHFGKIACAWSLAFVVPCAIVFGPLTAATEVMHTVGTEYLPFMILLFALFVVAGGIRIVGNLVGTPGTNTAMLAVGTVSASLLGTTGASMVLIRPLIRANQDRRHNIHVFIFFIFLVSNIGGSLTPLGDPPLFLGFLKGVDFTWTVTAMLWPMLLSSGLLLALFYVLDRRAWAREAPEVTTPSQVPRRVRLEGAHNVLLLGLVVLAVLLSGLWPGEAIHLALGIERFPSGLARDATLLLLSLISWKTTRPSIRVENAFTWLPIQEVAILFAGIFVTMIPALAILRAGRDGAMAPLLSLISHADGSPVNAAYFWLTGVLSSFLDNAPTYLVFFNLAGGDPQTLMGPLASTLLAISAGAVFMGANSYIGNAPNFMVKSICEEQGIRMPSFFGYMAWSGVILLPLFVLVTWVFFR
jgi:Na+/H+ antiporter NhaD/arsenite permease-like protein